MGIKPLEPGFKNFKVKPVSKMSELQGVVPTAFGNIKITLDKKDDKYNARVKTPASIVAEVDRSQVAQCTVDEK